ncbi:MAG: alpha/beta fold hydrolase, partial [Gemmatimonadota bacterium]
GEFFLCGHSMGGAIASQVAADYGRRVRRLILIDSAGIPGVGAGRILGRLLQPWTWCPSRFYSTLLGDILKAGPNVFRGIHHLRGFDVRPALKRVRAPTLIIWGAKDSLTPPGHGAMFADRLPNARLEMVPGARHLPMISHPEVVSRLVVRFLREDVKPGS